MQIETSKSDVAWGYIGKIFVYANSLLLLPFVFHFLSGDAIGLWYVFQSLGGIVSLFNFGFNPTFARNIAYAWSGVSSLQDKGLITTAGKKTEPNWKLFRSVVGSCKWIYLGVSSLALVILLTIGSWYIARISVNSSIQYLNMSWYIYLVSVFINLLFGYYDTLLLGIGDVRNSNRASIISKLIQFCLALMMLFMNLGLLAVSLAYFVGGISFRLFARHFFDKDLAPHAEQSPQGWISIGECADTLKKIWPNTWRDGIVQIANYLTSQATTLVCSFFFSLTETGMYSIGVQIAGALATVAYSMYGSMQPAIQSAVAVGDKEKQKKSLAYSEFAFVAIFLLGGLFVIFAGIPILNLIKPGAPFNRILVLLILVYYFFYQHHSICASFLSNYNTLPYVKAFIISGICSILLSVLLAFLFPQMGIYALVVAQILVQACYNNWKWPQTVYRLLNMSLPKLIVMQYKILISRKK